jgi:uncharacterized protein DUF3226
VTKNRLLVEGKDDMHALIHLLAHYVEWPQKAEDAPVFIVQCNGHELYESAKIPTTSKSYPCVGVVGDADENLTGRWTSIRTKMLDAFPTLPEVLPPEGVIAEHDGRRFGTWLMPDNQQHGMLESFLQWLIPAADNALWEYATSATNEARNHGKKYTDAHFDKARIHAWLAWVDPPGQSFGHALRSHVLDPKSPPCAAFVDWFIALYDLPRLTP